MDRRITWLRNLFSTSLYLSKLRNPGACSHFFCQGECERPNLQPLSGQTGSPSGKMLFSLKPTSWATMENPKEKTGASGSSSTGGKTLADQGIIENIFERALWNVRFIVLLGVVFGALQQLSCSLRALVRYTRSLLDIHGRTACPHPRADPDCDHRGGRLLPDRAGPHHIQFGIYELFISEIDIARLRGIRESSWYR